MREPCCAISGRHNHLACPTALKRAFARKGQFRKLSNLPPLGPRDIKMSDQLKQLNGQIASLENSIAAIAARGETQPPQLVSTGALPPLSAAERMRRHRERRRDGLRCLTIELRETEIDALIRKGMLKTDARNDRDAILNALYAHLEHTLDAML